MGLSLARRWRLDNTSPASGTWTTLPCPALGLLGARRRARTYWRDSKFLLEVELADRTLGEITPIPDNTLADDILNPDDGKPCSFWPNYQDQRVIGNSFRSRPVMVSAYGMRRGLAVPCPTGRVCRKRHLRWLASRCEGRRKEGWCAANGNWFQSLGHVVALITRLVIGARDKLSPGSAALRVGGLRSRIWQSLDFPCVVGAGVVGAMLRI